MSNNTLRGITLVRGQKPGYENSRLWTRLKNLLRRLKLFSMRRDSLNRREIITACVAAERVTKSLVQCVFRFFEKTLMQFLINSLCSQVGSKAFTGKNNSLVIFLKV